MEAQGYELVPGAGVTDEFFHHRWTFFVHNVHTNFYSLVGDVLVDLFLLLIVSRFLVRYWRDSTRMKSFLESCISMVYLEPQLEVMGKRVVWSVENFPVTSNTLTSTRFYQTSESGSGDSRGVITSSVWLGACLVERTFFYSCLRWTFSVAMDCSVLFQSREEVSPEQVAKKRIYRLDTCWYACTEGGAVQICN